MDNNYKRFLKVIPYSIEDKRPIPIAYESLIDAIEREEPGVRGEIVIRALEVDGYIETTILGERQLTQLGMKEGLAYGVGGIPYVPRAVVLGDETAWSDFRLLCKYFIECVSLSEQDQCFIHYKHWNTQWFLPILPVGWTQKTEASSFRLSISQHERPAYNFLCASELDSQDIFLGYPVCDVWSGNVNQQTPIFTPIFLIPAKIIPDAGTRYYDVVLDFSAIRINSAWFEFNLGEMSKYEFFRTLNTFEDESGRINLESAIEFLKNRMRTSKAQSDSLDPNKLRSDLQNFERNKRKIRNTAILFRGTDVRYNKGLIHDLRVIAEAPAETLEHTALAYVFRNPPLPSGTSSCQSVALPFIKSNFSQGIAVEDALNSFVSVVTGPPGTGKSQVAVNIIANLILRGESVLFTSKNHKAVHAIQEKVKNLEEECNKNSANVILPLIEFCSSQDGSEGTEWRKASLQKRLGVGKAILGGLKRDGNFIDGDCLKDFVVKTEKNIRTKSVMAEEIRTLRNALSCILIEKENKENALRISFNKPSCDLSSVDTESIRSTKLLAEKYLRNTPKTIFQRLIAWFSRHREKLERALSVLDAVTPREDDVFTWLSEIGKLCTIVDRLKEIEIEKTQLLLRVKEAEKKNREALDILSTLWGRFCEYGECGTRISPEFQVRWVNIQAERICSISKEELDFFERIQGVFDRLGLQGARTLLSEELLDAERAFEVFLKCFPAWACTSLSLRKSSPCLPGVFTRVIIDEAAQCDTPSVIPALYRAKGVVVIGDNQQFPPVITLSPKKHDKLWSRYRLDQCYNKTARKFSFLNPQGTIYGACSVVKSPILLNEHFRCNSAIAEYFNHAYYEGKLVVRTPEKENISIKSGVEWIDVQNSLDGELMVVKDYLKSLSRIKYTGSIGVITPLRKTVETLRSYLYSIGELPGFDIQNDVNTVNGFQGGERDVIIFVLGITDQLRKGQIWYSESEENRYIYNVAASRARNALIVVGDRTRAQQSSLKELRELAKERPTRKERFGSLYEKMLYEAMRKRGLTPLLQYPVAGRYLDLALVDKKIDIEVDGVWVHMNSAGDHNEADIQREMILKANGWRTIRFWSHEIKDSPEACVDKILALYQSPMD